jgi:hypothetical protein
VKSGFTAFYFNFVTLSTIGNAPYLALYTNQHTIESGKYE